MEPKCTADRFPGIAATWASVLETAGECPSYPLCRVQPIAFHQSRPPVYSPSLNDPCTRCLSQPTTSSHCLALTLSRSTRSHTVSLYLVLTPSQVRSHTSCLIVPSSVNLSRRLALFRIDAVSLIVVAGLPRYLILRLRAIHLYNAPRVRRCRHRTGDRHRKCHFHSVHYNVMSGCKHVYFRAPHIRLSSI